MKKKHGLLFSFSILLMAAIFSMTSCENGTQAVEGTVNVTNPSIEAPNVTPTAIAGGVQLSWDPIVDAEGYQVWRKLSADSSKDKELSSSSLTTDPVTGKKIYYDVVSDTNQLAANTKYVYTVVAKPLSTTRDPVKWSGEVTTSDVPAKGTKVAAPTSVTLALDSEKNQITVTVTPPTTGIIPTYYQAYIFYPNSYSSFSQPVTIISPQTTGTVDWTSSDQYEGDYTAGVIGTLGSGSGSSGDSYYASSDPKVSSPVKHEALISGSASINPGSIDATPDSSNTIKVYVPINLYSLIVKAGVTYTIERATVGTDGTLGTYSSITPKASFSGSANASLTVDVLGHLVPTSVYDYGVPDGTYQYRVKAVKGTQTPQYKEISISSSSRNQITIKLRDYISGSLTVAAPDSTTDTTKKNLRGYAWFHFGRFGSQR